MGRYVMGKIHLIRAGIIFTLLFSLCAGAVDLTPDAIVMETTKEVVDRLDMDRDKLQAEPGYIKKIVRELIVPHMDFRTMAALVLGKDWDLLNHNVQECFTSGFRNMLVERYSDILFSYHDQDIRYDPPRPIGTKGYVSVLQTLTHGNRKPLTIGYPMRADGESWRVVDLVVDEVSLVRSYRIMFEKEVKHQGLADFIHSFEDCRD